MEPARSDLMTPTLKRSRKLLARWRERLLGLRRATRGSGADERTTELWQQVEDRWDRVEVQIARTEMLEQAWRRSISDTESAFAELDLAWRALERTCSDSSDESASGERRSDERTR